jgi:hypothetical protein
MVQELYDSLTGDRIIFMKDLNDFFDISPRSKYKYFNLPRFEMKEISQFLYYLDPDNIYIVIPLITISRKLDDPHLILSRQFFVGNKSNPINIQNFLGEQMNKASEQFNMELDDYTSFFKFRKVFISRNSKLN